MAEITDLDKLLPEPREITISGKVVKVYPGKLKTLIALQKAFGAFEKSEPSERLSLLESVLDPLSAIMPAIKDDDVDVGFEQVAALVELAYKMSIPETPQAQASGMVPEAKTTEKKSLKA